MDLSDIKTVKVRLNEVERYRLEPGDVLMTEGGDIDKLGAERFGRGKFRLLHQPYISREGEPRNFSIRVLRLVVESDIAKSYFMRVAKRTTNLASTNKTQVRAFSFPVPPCPNRNKLQTLFRRQGDATGVHPKRGSLKQLKRSLMHDLLTARSGQQSHRKALLTT